MRLSSCKIVFLERQDDDFSKNLDQSPPSALWLFWCGVHIKMKDWRWFVIKRWRKSLHKGNRRTLCSLWLHHDTPLKTGSNFLIDKCNRDTLMNTKNQTTKNDDKNPFKDMGFIKFWIVSTVFWFSFPVSLVLCYLALGSVKTKQLVKALVHDFLQTLFIILVVVCVIVNRVTRKSNIPDFVCCI